jgi:hypothetical protein
MSILPQLERDLLKAAERRLAVSADGGVEPSDIRLGVPARARRLRLPALALGCLLATTTIALAATGVILTGAPVRPEGRLNPSAGEGVPAPGASQLLDLRASDPEGGLPWGMRIVRTTRGEVCEQIGRIQDDQLGELGIDGVFHDDGRLHPMPADVLPETSRVGMSVHNNDASESVSCQLAGHAVVGEHVGVDRSAGAANGHAREAPRSELRDIYYGLLGPQAVSVSYRDGHKDRTVAVLSPIGAYLIVRRTRPGEQVGTGEEGLGTEGDLPPSPPLTEITYRLDERLCERGPTLPPGVVQHLADPCPQPHWPTGHPGRMQDLHRPVHAHLQISHRLITGAQVSFTAPYAVTSASYDYSVAIPPCGRTGIERGYSGTSLDRNVARGSIVRLRLDDPFTEPGCQHHTVTIDVLYQHRAGGGSVIVGSTTIHEPPGTRPATSPTGPSWRHALL